MKQRRQRRKVGFMRRILSAFFTVILLLAALAGCRKSGEPVSVMDQVVTKGSEGFLFAETDWTMTKDEVMKKLNVTPETVTRNLEDRFTVPVHINEFDTDGWATYVFLDENVDENQPFCSGWYAFELTGSWKAIAEQMRETAVKTLQEPKEENMWDSGTYMIWKAEDGSSFAINVGINDAGTSSGGETVHVTLSVCRLPDLGEISPP